MNWKTILVPTDFSEHSKAALLLARDIAAEQDARLVVVHVVADALPALLPDVAGFRYDEVVEALGQRAQESLPKFFPEDERRGVAVEFRVVFGAPHAEITTMSVQQNCSVFEQQPMEIRRNFAGYCGSTNSEIQVMKINRLRSPSRSRPCNSRRRVVEIPTPLWGREGARHGAAMRDLR